jgi:serine/threonine-protein kinase
MIGQLLGPYRVLDKLGEGGMGEVYRARDSKLHRDVALKILPEAFATDFDRLARFKREAQILASLNHPNIGGIYGLEESNGVQALVLELVEGPTLAEVIEARQAAGVGPRGMPIDEALPIARQIAEALETAHEQGIIHRDLKPSNIKLRPDGTVKVLDFGLAKALEPVSAMGTDATASPTITSPAMTGIGVILGTAAYMSPEQAKGRTADKRSDVWAFGAVLYEMLTGTRAFDGEDVNDTAASVLKSDPDWSLLPPDVPSPVLTLVRSCLVKDRRQRVSDISTATFILKELGGIGATRRAPATPANPITRHSPAPAIAMAVALTAVVVGAGAWALWPTPDPPTVVQFAITPTVRALTGAVGQVVAISPDGTRLAYTADGRMYVRSMNDLEARVVADSNPNSPVFAPDGESLLFTTVSDRGVELKRIAVGGGAASRIATLEGAPNYSGISWSREGILVGVTGEQRGIFRIPPNGGTPERIVSVEPSEMAHGPQMLPDGRAVIFTLAKSGDGADRWDRAQIIAQSLADGTRRVLIEGGSDGRYVESGHLLYAVGGTMYAQRFDAATLTVTGAPVPVVAGVRRVTGGVSGTALLGTSETGTMVYVPGPATFASSMSLVLGDARGNTAPLKVPFAPYVHPRVSPDGRVLAVGRHEGQSSDIWTYDLSGKAEIKRVTFDGMSRFPVWFADSRRVTFQSARDGDLAIWWQAADGGRAERLTRAAEGEEHVPELWSPAGTHLLFSVRKAAVYSLWVLTLEGRKVEPFGEIKSADPLGASFSPDGQWIAYAATERTGGVLSPNRGVFVEPFPSTGEKYQAPKLLLDYHPLWAPGGTSLFYIPGANRPIVSVPITTRPSVAFGRPVELPSAPMPGRLSIDVRGYDVLRDGRFVSVAPASSEGQTPSVEIRVTLNWFEELKRLVPTK